MTMVFRSFAQKPS